MSLSSASMKMHGALKDLRRRWEQATSEWNDPVSQNFEENHLQPLEQQVLATLGGIERLDQVMLQARKDCE